MRRVLRWIGLGFALLIVLHTTIIAALHWRHYEAFGHLAPFGLHANAEFEDTPDVALRAVVIANFGLLPKRIRICHARTDINEPISFIEFIVEEWHAKYKGWRPLPSFNWDSFCKGMVTSHGDGEIRSDWLLPGQTLREETGVPLRHEENSQYSVFRLRLLIDPDNPETRPIFTPSFPVPTESPARMTRPAQ